MTTLNPSIKILRLSAVLSLVGISKSSIWDRLNPKSPRYDPTFPKRVKLGGRAIGFVDVELQAWLQKRMDARC